MYRIISRSGSNHKFYTWWKIWFFLLLDTAFSVCNVLFFSSVSTVSCFSVPWYPWYLFWTAYWSFLENSRYHILYKFYHLLGTYLSESESHKMMLIRHQPDPDHNTDVCYMFYNYSWSGSETLLYSARTVVLERSTCKFYIYRLGIYKVFFFILPLTYVLQMWNMSRVPPPSYPTRKADRISRTRIILCTGSTGAGRTSPPASGTSVWERTRSNVRPWSSWTPTGCSLPRSGLWIPIPHGSALSWVAGSGSGSRRARLTSKYRKSKEFAWFEMLDVLFWRLSCSLCVLYGGLGIIKLHFFIKKYPVFFQLGFFSIFCHQNPGFETGSGSGFWMRIKSMRIHNPRSRMNTTTSRKLWRSRPGDYFFSRLILR